MQVDDSYIVADPSGKVKAYVGPDATRLVQAKLLKISLGMYKLGLRPTRHLTLTKALALATGLTGHAYKRGDVALAQADLEIWITTMTCALPVEVDK